MVMLKWYITVALPTLVTRLSAQTEETTAAMVSHLDHLLEDRHEFLLDQRALGQDARHLVQRVRQRALDRRIPILRQRVIHLKITHTTQKVG